MNVRKSNVTFNQWNELTYAFEQVLRSGKYVEFWKIHRRPAGKGMKHRMHGMSDIGFERFLPWHRVFLLQMEKELRKYVPGISIPYWDWVNDQGNLTGFQNLDSLLEIVPRLWSRFPYNNLPISQNQLDHLINNVSDYTLFSKKLELGPHIGGHSWANGDMIVMADSPKDPLFYFHHAMVDKVWSEWQINNPGKKSTKLSEKDEKMDPWDTDYNIHNINDISNLGNDSYTYQ